MAALVGKLVSQPHYMHEILHFFAEKDPFLKRLIDMSKFYNS
jgi:hypothetical protein